MNGLTKALKAHRTLLTGANDALQYVIIRGKNGKVSFTSTDNHIALKITMDTEDDNFIEGALPFKALKNYKSLSELPLEAVPPYLELDKTLDKIFYPNERKLRRINLTFNVKVMLKFTRILKMLGIEELIISDDYTRPLAYVSQQTLDYDEVEAAIVGMTF